MLEVLTIELKRLLCLSREPWVLDVLFSVTVLVNDEWRDQCHDWLVEGVHDHQLTCSTNELLHLPVRPCALFMTELLANSAT